MLKTTVMMIGEFEFDDLFFDNVNNSEDAMLPFNITTLVFFLAFVCIMSIIVMNLLVIKIALYSLLLSNDMITCLINEFKLCYR